MKTNFTTEDLRTALENAIIGAVDSQLQWLFGKDAVKRWEEDNSDEKVFREVWFQLKNNLKIDNI